MSQNRGAVWPENNKPGGTNHHLFYYCCRLFYRFRFFRDNKYSNKSGTGCCWVFKGTNIDSDTSLPDWIVTSTQLCMAVAQSTETPFIKNIFIAGTLSRPLLVAWFLTLLACYKNVSERLEKWKLNYEIYWIEKVFRASRVTLSSSASDNHLVIFTHRIQ